MEEKKIKEIEKQAKGILEKFSKALKNIEEFESDVEREVDRRKDGAGLNGDSEFRKIMFENAPQKNEDFIIAEKKSW